MAMAMAMTTGLCVLTSLNMIQVWIWSKPANTHISILFFLSVRFSWWVLPACEFIDLWTELITMMMSCPMIFFFGVCLVRWSCVPSLRVSCVPMPLCAHAWIAVAIAGVYCMCGCPGIRKGVLSLAINRRYSMEGLKNVKVSKRVWSYDYFIKAGTELNDHTSNYANVRPFSFLWELIKHHDQRSMINAPQTPLRLFSFQHKTCRLPR